MKNIKAVVEAIKKAKNIAIISHVGPDGDTLGSMLGLKFIIHKCFPEKNIETIVNGKIPDIYKFLPGSKNVKTPDDNSLLTSYDAAIAVDCASVDRMGEAFDVFKSAKCKINLDHHITNNGFGDINHIKPQASSTGEVVFDILKSLEVELDKEIAVNIYTAILTDTGGFRFENTTPKTFEIVAGLVKAGVHPGDIYKYCYESKPIQMVKLAAYAINNAVFCDDDKIAYTLITREEMKNLDASDDHIDGISEALRQINTMEVAMILKETPRKDTKISFRSNGVDVCKIAEFFGGGGHKLAAGCTIQKQLNDALNEILPIVRKQVRNGTNKKNTPIYS